jgi:hypothetical protein
MSCTILATEYNRNLGVDCDCRRGFSAKSHTIPATGGNCKLTVNCNCEKGLFSAVNHTKGNFGHRRQL